MDSVSTVNPGTCRCMACRTTEPAPSAPMIRSNRRDAGSPPSEDQVTVPVPTSMSVTRLWNWNSTSFSWCSLIGAMRERTMSPREPVQPGSGQSCTTRP